METKTEDISFGDDGDEEVFYEESGSAEDNKFDAVVGALEEILLGESFTKVQKGFCDEHCEIFVDSEENKIEYTELFQSYTIIIEKALDDELRQKIPDFSMPEFESLLVDRKDEIDIEIFDLLMSLGDFSEFKILMLSHKKAKIAENIGGSAILTVFGTQVTGNPTTQMNLEKSV